MNPKEVIMNNFIQNFNYDLAVLNIVNDNIQNEDIFGDIKKVFGLIDESNLTPKDQGYYFYFKAIIDAKGMSNREEVVNNLQRYGNDLKKVGNVEGAKILLGVE